MNVTHFEKALTFSDVSLVPRYSEHLPGDVSLKSSIGKNITLNAPILSAAMDTVTTSPMAIAMAQSGGLGVIHKNMSINDQALEVFRVKKYEAWVISRPITINPDATIEEARILVQEQGVSGFPVVTTDNHLIGMLTARDIRFADEGRQKVRDVMSEKLVVAKPTANTKICIDLMKEKRVEKLPLVDDEGRLEGLVTIKDINKSSVYPDSVRDLRGRLCCGAALGVGPDLEERAHALVNAGADALVLDAAHGHSKGIGDALKKVRSWFPEIDIIAGNVVSADGARFLADSGADAVKVGVGPGSICTTRIVAGVGVPQLSAILEASKAAKERGVRLIADGGIQFSGDIVKAFAAGGHAVMTGSLLAGTKEAPGERILFGGREFKAYRGMGSLGAMRQGSNDRYGQAKVSDKSKFVPEGIEGKIPYRGEVKDVVFQLMGGVRAGMGYAGAKNIQELQEVAQFVKVSAAGQRESHVHDVTITKESPNYYFQD